MYVCDQRTPWKTGQGLKDSLSNIEIVTTIVYCSSSTDDAMMGGGGGGGTPCLI